MEKTFPACNSSIRPIKEHLLEQLRDFRINGKLCGEYELLIEEIATKLILCAEEDSEITVQVKRRLGKISAKIRCPGRPVFLESESSTDFSGQIIEEFSEGIRQSYTFGVNEVVFSTSSSSNETLFKCILSLILAVIAGFALRLFCTDTQLVWIDSNIAAPVTFIFVRAVQTMAVPVTFFSLAAFVVTLRRTFDRNNNTVRLCLKYMLSSLVAVFIGLCFWRLFSGLFAGYDLSSFRISEDNFIGTNIKDFLAQIVSSNILEPFLITNPIPVLVNALLTGLAASSLFGKTGEMAHRLLDTINDLFARMMNIIYSTIPFFLFLAVLDLILHIGFSIFPITGIMLCAMLCAMAVLVLYYALRLAVGGVNPLCFVREYRELLRENLNIGSNIDAFPYNKRMLARKTGLSRDYLREGLKLGTLLNMDGNCLVVTVFIMELIIAVRPEISAAKYAGLAIILLLFSFGAPNHPGSIIIGMTLMMSFVGISGELIGVVLIVEALLSKFYSFLNAAGDIVTLAIEDSKLKKKGREAGDAE